MPGVLSSDPLRDRKPEMTLAFAGGATAMSLARLLILAVLHLAKTDYNPIRDAVSDYAVGPTRRLSTAMTWAALLPVHSRDILMEEFFERSLASA